MSTNEPEGDATREGFVAPMIRAAAAGAGCTYEEAVHLVAEHWGVEGQSSRAGHLESCRHQPRF